MYKKITKKYYNFDTTITIPGSDYKGSGCSCNTGSGSSDGSSGDSNTNEFISSAAVLVNYYYSNRIDLFDNYYNTTFSNLKSSNPTYVSNLA
jgi:hypothetical protein